MNIQQAGKEEREYYVAFKDEERLGWFFKLFTSPGFGHCFLIMPLGPDHCVIVDQNIMRIDVLVHAQGAKETAKHLVSQKIPVVHFKQKPKQKIKLKTGIIFPTCVQLCQRISGRSFWAFTPKSYFKALIRSGACLMSA